MSVTIIVRFHAADGKAKALKELLQQGRDASRESEGCEAFDLYQGKETRQQFVIVQRWSSDAAHMANFDSKIKGSGHLAKISQLLAKPIERAVFNLI